MYTRDDKVVTERLAWVAALALSVSGTAATAGISFTDATDAAGVSHQSETFGASWGDLNGDGYPDLFVSNHRTPDSLFLNRGNGTFVDTGKQVLTWINHKNGDDHGGSWADFDNDGDQDLLVSTGTGNLIQFLVNEHDALVNRTVQYGLDTASVGGRMPVWLDFNGDHLLDVVLTQYGKQSRVMRQNKGGGGFTDATVGTQINCFGYHYAHLFDANGDGRLDFLCPDQTLFPQKIYDTRPFPWQTLFDSSAPNSLFPTVPQVVDSIIADFNNDGLTDMFLLSGVQMHASSVVQGGPATFEAQLAGGTKGFNFDTAGSVTFKMDWNKADEGTPVDLAKIHIGSGGRHPAAIPFTLDPTDPTVAGMPAPPAVQTDLPSMQIGFNRATQQWTLVLWTSNVDGTSTPIFSVAYLQVSSTTPISSLQSTGLWPSDKPSRPTLLLNTGSGFVDATVASGLGAAIQCASVTAGDFDNDMDVDLYLACGSGASNTANILYENLGNGTFTAVPNTGGAAGPVGVAVGSGAGTADSVVSADYDVDGFLDLFVTNGLNLRPLYYGGPNQLFHNNGNGNHWIEIDLVGTKSDRDATGARIYATAGGVTQLRVQNGAYHRWSQDMKRSHFGLAGNATVNLKVVWPSGTVENYTNVAADRLYRLTEKSGVAPVALGVAPAYPCGAPTLNGATDSGVFIWKDCPTGQWRLKTASGGAKLLYSGRVNSSAAFTTVKPVGLSLNDSVNYTSDPQQISFSLHTYGSDTDGVNFLPQDGATNCLRITAPGTAKVYFGPFRVPLTQPLELDTQQSCP